MFLADTLEALAATLGVLIFLIFLFLIMRILWNLGSYFGRR